MRRNMIFVFVFLVLNACAVTENDRVNVDAGLETERPLSTPLLTLTTVPVDSPTSLPSKTNTPALPYETPTATAFPLPFPTIPSGYRESESWLDVSPNGEWTAYGQWLFEIAEDELVGYRMLLILENEDRSLQWIAVDEKQGVGMGYSLPVVHHWSAFDDAVYITKASLPDGGVGCQQFINGSNLIQVNLTNGEAKEHLPSEHFSIAISPTEEQVAAMTAREGVRIYHLFTDEVNYIPLDVEYGNGGSFAWSPDSKQVIFARVTDNLTEVGCLGSAHDLLLLDLNSLTITTLLDADERRFIPQQWQEDGTVLLQDGEENLWQYSFSDHTVTLLLES